jgi:hypothetical protein
VALELARKPAFERPAVESMVLEPGVIAVMLARKQLVFVKAPKS